MFNNNLSWVNASGTFAVICGESRGSCNTALEKIKKEKGKYPEFVIKLWKSTSYPNLGYTPYVSLFEFLMPKGTNYYHYSNYKKWLLVDGKLVNTHKLQYLDVPVEVKKVIAAAIIFRSVNHHNPVAVNKNDKSGIWVLDDEVSKMVDADGTTQVACAIMGLCQNIVIQAPDVESAQSIVNYSYFMNMQRKVSTAIHYGKIYIHREQLTITGKDYTVKANDKEIDSGIVDHLFQVEPDDWVVDIVNM